MKRLAILGSTGSIGRQTLEVVRAFPDRFRVIGLGAGKNLDLLARQVAEFRPRLISLQSPAAPRAALPPGEYELASLEDTATHPEVDLVVVATSGKAGLGPTLAALKAGKSIALANKEVLVMAGEIVTAEAREHAAEILPIDSEHSAIWQCLRGEPDKGVSRLILTASGGPFLHLPLEQLATVGVEETLRHPTWQMGKKVTVDSATLMNKGMEVIEAHWLFNMPYDSIEVVAHPQSIVHALVEFVDGSVKAELGPPDMRLPIQYALTYPERLPNPKLRRLDWSKIRALDFEAVDWDRFPCLRLAVEAGKRGGTYPAVLSAADEVAAELFLSQRIGFLDIPRLVETALEQHQGRDHPSLEEVLAADAWSREITLRHASRGNPC